MTCTLIDKLRGPKIFDMALFDWMASLLLAFIIGKYLFKFQGSFHWSLWIMFWTLFGVFTHLLVGVPTMFGYYLSLNSKPERIHC